MGTTMEHWKQIASLGPDEGWEKLSENGWFAMLAWAAGPANVRKSVQSDEGQSVKCTSITDGVESTWQEPFTTEDRAAVEGAINSFLAEAGIPPRPSGFVWYLWVPPDCAGTESVADELSSRIVRAQQEEQTPAELWPLFERIAAAFYARTSS